MFMRLELTLLISLITLTAFATANVWQPEENVDRSFENDNWEIIVQDMEAGGGTLEAKANQQGKRTMYLDRRPVNEMVSNCKTLYGASITDNPSPCQDFKTGILG